MLPKWEFEERPEIEGVYLAERDNGDIEPVWLVLYGDKAIFQRKCGTEEGREGWNGNVGHVIGWCDIYIPEGG